VYYKGKWATIRYPNAIGTWLWGISNAGVMVGSAQLKSGSTIGFLYKNGKFETLTPSGTAISLRTGLILGNGFIAKCK